MKIFAICIVKDEVDVLEKVIESASIWADKIIIADHCSSDGTWELINNNLSKLPNVIVYGRITESFTDGIRAKIYEKYKNIASKDDWWCRLDSDEIYIDNPRDFLSKISKIYSVVRAAKFQYYFTEKDLYNFNINENSYLNGESVTSLKYYVCNESETRFVRHTGNEWRSKRNWPDSDWPNLIYHTHIRMKHFQYRYPEQIQHRIDIRVDLRKRFDIFNHEVRDGWSGRISNRKIIDQTPGSISFEQSWKDRVLSSNDLNYDNGYDYIVTQELMPSKIRPSMLQIIRSTIFLILGKVKDISTR